MNGLGLFALCFLTAGFLVTMLLLSSFLGPKKLTRVKDDPFECGTIGSGDPKQRMGIKFYLVAMIFILFDVEIVFLFPWAVSLAELGWMGFAAMSSFIVVLVVGLIYIWRRGVLDWA